MKKLNEEKLLYDLKEKYKIFKKEYDATGDHDRFMRIEGQLNILQHYIEQIEIGNFDS